MKVKGMKERLTLREVEELEQILEIVLDDELAKSQHLDHPVFVMTPDTKTMTAIAKKGEC